MEEDKHDTAAHDKAPEKDAMVIDDSPADTPAGAGDEQDELIGSEEEEEEEEEEEDDSAMFYDESDPVVAELPVYLSNSLSKFLYLLQYPMRQIPFQPRQGPVAARIKPNAKMVQLDLPLDTRSAQYNPERGEEFAMGTHDKAMKTAYDRRMEEVENERQGFHSAPKKDEELLDKITLTSTRVPTQTNYLVGVIHEGDLHVTPLNTMIQMRPGFNYLDKIDDKVKAVNRRIQEVSMKQGDAHNATRRNLYSMAVRNADEETWENVTYYDEHSPEAEAAYQGLYCASQAHLKSTTTPAAFLDQLSGLK
ncbi:Sin-like protein conserved region-domain-containing protein [Gongronella butleri]|nr:Sin-like protein conserved region-domain-containing protein [Gongronella butleri]